jgi:ABC-type multidrug transport system ATPase subunit
MQDDIIMKTQTPREVFMFAAKLKIPKSVMKTDEERQQRVDHLINQLGLQRSQNTQVGATGEKRGISGGKLTYSFFLTLKVRENVFLLGMN